MNQYRLFHRGRSEFTDVSAHSAQEACLLAGWLIEDCWVRYLTPRVPDPTSESGYRGGGWENVTPRVFKNN